MWRAGTDDVIDASVALVAAQPTTRALYASEPADLARLVAAAGPHRPRIVAV